MYFDGDDRIFEISENDLIEFLQNYGEEFNITSENKKNRSQIELVSDEGINLAIDKETREMLLNTGCDFSSVFKEYEQQQEHKETTEEKTERIEENTALIEYKETFFKKLVNRIKENLKKVKEKIFNNRGKKTESDTQDNSEANQAEEKLPWWDLRNWTPEELEEAKVAASKAEKTKTEIRETEAEK